MKSYRCLSLLPTIRHGSCRTRYHYSTPSRHTTQDDVLRVGKFVLGSLLVLGTGFYASRYEGALPILTRLEGTATSAQFGSRSESEELPYAYLKTSNPEGLLNTGGSGVTGDALWTSSTSPAPTYGSPEDVGRAIEELREALPGKNRIKTSPDSLQAHGSSANSYHPSFPHSVVVMAHSTDDVVKVVDISRKYRVPIIASGGATSLEGHFSGVRLNCLS